ncbi:DinB family protein [Nocardioides campestrisoli]|uniref:DinB family protein n=1 Tax=Nocardioides campestrisoli TaxID=2736757 RepID=UPI00163DE537|nr:DinB family protein [Nocardioides campestrisoli]
MTTPVKPTDADETTTLRGFLAHFRAVVRSQCEGLDADQLDTPLPPTTMTLGGLLKHLAYVEQWWFSCVLHGEEPSGIWADVDWSADEDWDWHSASEDSPVELLTLFDAEVAAADLALDRALAVGGLDQLAAVQRRGRGISLRYILVHMIEEYARHAGHGDLLRENVDGTTGL